MFILNFPSASVAVEIPFGANIFTPSRGSPCSSTTVAVISVPFGCAFVVLAKQNMATNPRISILYIIFFFIIYSFEIKFIENITNLDFARILRKAVFGQP